MTDEPKDDLVREIEAAIRLAVQVGRVYDQKLYQRARDRIVEQAEEIAVLQADIESNETGDMASEIAALRAQLAEREKR